MNARPVDDIIEQALAHGHAALDEASGKALLAQFGIRTPRSDVVGDAAAGSRSSAQMQGPFVVKVVSRDILHKSDAGGVALGLPDAEAVAAAIREMEAKPAIQAARVDGKAQA